MTEEIKRQIAGNKFAEALALLKKAISEHKELKSLEKEVILLSRRLHELQTGNLRGVESPDEEKRERNRIGEALLMLVDRMEATLNPSSDPGPVSKPEAVKIPAAGIFRRRLGLTLVAALLLIAGITYVINTNRDPVNPQDPATATLTPSDTNDEPTGAGLPKQGSTTKPSGSAGPFLAAWYNQNPSSDNITKVVFREGNGSLKVAMEKKHQPTDMGEHETSVQDGKVSLDFTMYNIGIRFKPVFSVQNKLLKMDMVQLNLSGERIASYTEYFGKAPPVVPPPPEPVHDDAVTAADFAGIWKNQNAQSVNIEKFEVEALDANRLRITVTKVYPPKELGVHTATLQNGKVNLDFSAAGYIWRPALFLHDGRLTMQMIQLNADGSAYAPLYTEYFSKN